MHINPIKTFFLMLILLASSVSISFAGDTVMDCDPEPTDMNIAYGEFMTGGNCVIGSGGDVDLFRFNGTAGDHVVLSLGDGTFSSLQNPCFEVRDSANQIVVPNTCTASNNKRVVEFLLPSSGSYLILVKENSNDAVHYGLSLERLVPPTASSDTIPCYGCMIASDISALGDLDPYLFSASAGDQILITLTDGTFSSLQNPCMSLRNLDGIPTSNGANKCAPSNNVTTIEQTIPETGTYTILVSEDSNDAVNFGLDVQCLVGPCIGTLLLQPPAQVDASDGTYTDRIAVSWSAVPSATAYNIYVSNTLVSLKTYWGQTAQTSVDITSSTPEVIYIWVYSTNSVGESATGTYDTGYRAMTVQEQRARDLIESFYVDILGRGPELGAVDNWYNGYFEYAVSFGIDVRFVPREMARVFFLSAEYASRNRTDEQFIRDCYQVFLSRQPSAEELAGWLSGVWERAEAMTLFAESQEFGDRILAMFSGLSGNPTRNFVTTLYIGLLDRLVDSGGLEFSTELFNTAYANGGRAGVRAEARNFGRTVLGSAEYLSKSPTNATHVIRLYRAYLGRFPAQSEVDYWAGELNASRQTTDTLIDVFAAAAEFTDRLNTFF